MSAPDLGGQAALLAMTALVARIEALERENKLLRGAAKAQREQMHRVQEALSKATNSLACYETRQRKDNWVARELNDIRARGLPGYMRRGK